MAVAADVVVDFVMNDRVVRRAVQADAEARVEREVVVPNHHATGSHQQQSIHAADHDVTAHLGALDVLQIDRGSKPQPFVLLVVMEGQPVDQALVLYQAEEPRLPVVAEIVVPERQLPSAAREDTDLVSMDRGLDDADVAAAVDDDGGVAGLIGIGLGIRALQRSATEIDGDVVAAHNDRSTRKAIRLGDNTDRPRDDHPRLQLDRAWGDLRKHHHYQQHGSNLCSALSFRSSLPCRSWRCCWRSRWPRSPRPGGGITTATRRSSRCSRPHRSSCISESTLPSYCTRSSTNTSASSSSLVRSSSSRAEFTCKAHSRGRRSSTRGCLGWVPCWRTCSAPPVPRSC